MYSRETFCLHQLLHAPGLRKSQILQLISQYGSAEGIIQSGLNPQNGTLFNTWKIEGSGWEKDLEEVEKGCINLVSYRDEAYPPDLLNIPDFPLLLYVKGSLPERSPCVALIGTRNATLYGKQSAERLSKELAEAGVWIISGLARGIDTAAHQGALEALGKTVAVIGSGLNRLYPQENLLLAQKISSSGAVISEYPMLTPPSKGLFPRRNRIISGMSHAICLVESPLEGGGILTMSLAEKQGRPLLRSPDG